MPTEPDPSFWNHKTVLVTGSGGFAGGHLCEYLYSLGANVRCLIRPGEDPPIRGPRSKTSLGDVRNFQNLLEAFDAVDVAFHLAAITEISEARADVFSTFATNSLGTLNFLNAARQAKTSKLVYVSTGQVYGKQSAFPISEGALPHPIDIYSASKLAGENLAVSFVEMYQMDVSISRAFNHYGPRQRPQFLIPDVMLRLLDKAPLQVRNATATRDFTYVSDIVRGYVLLAERGKPSHIYNLCSGVERSVEHVVETIMKIAGAKHDFPQNSGTKLLEISRSVGDYSKAREELGWEPQIPFDDGITRTLAWYRANTAFAKRPAAP